MSRQALGWAVGLLLLACACAPDATPLPPNLPTQPPPTPTQGTPPPLRYAVAPDLQPYLSAADADLIGASAEIVRLDAPPSDLDGSDIVISLADLPGRATAPSPLEISLILDPTLPPLDDPALLDIVRHAIDPLQIAAALNLPGAATPADPVAAAAALRNQLANAGYPDGFDLTLASGGLPGAEALAQQFEAIGIQIRATARADQPAHLTLATDSNNPDALSLYAVTIHYRAAEGLDIIFTPDGFPIARRTLQ